jgi:glycosyltransferase involved in cell wall biosynthesis
MRVGISLLTLVPGISGGSETYARALTRTLAAEGTLDYRVFLPTIAADAGGGLDSTVVTRYRASRGMPGRIAAMASAALHPGPLRQALELDRLDVVHFPLSVMLPPVAGAGPPAVTTVLDVQHEVFPEFFSRAELAYRRRVYGWTVRRSRRVVTISEHAKQALVERLGLPPDKVRVIYLAVDHERFTPGDEGREPFLLYPANPWPHKNHRRLLEAFRLVRAQHPDLRLVLTGHGHEEPVPEGVEIAGRVPLDELVSLYRRASAVVFPSLYEGFGQPPLEALACATPVACSDIPPLREVCGDAAVYFDPTQPEAIAAGIEEALRRGPELSAAGPARAARFTWSENARLHEDVYRELAA